MVWLWLMLLLASRVWTQHDGIFGNRKSMRMFVDAEWAAWHIFGGIVWDSRGLLMAPAAAAAVPAALMSLTWAWLTSE